MVEGISTHAGKPVTARGCLHLPRGHWRLIWEVSLSSIALFSNTGSPPELRVRPARAVLCAFYSMTAYGRSE